MDVRFQCPACDQPIEVDGEWAGSAVACPYCQKTVTAPASSTFQPNVPPPTAQPLAGIPGVAPSIASADPATYGAQVQPRKTLAIIACVLGAFALMSSIVFWSTLGSHPADARKLMEFMQEMQTQGQAANPELQKELNDLIFANPGIQAVVYAGLFGMCAGGPAWLAGLICAIIAMTKPHSRRLAIVALVLLTLCLVASCVLPSVVGSSVTPAPSG